uniref:Uncharacterized protein n=1 Tax=Arcella intermedia TaxID=1963864 RepID=A0A6B2LHE9_9EUKA
MEDNESWKLWKEKKEAEISQKAKQTEDKRQKRDKLVLELEKLKKEVVVDESSYEASYQILKDLKKKYKDHIENCSSLPFDFQEEYGNLERFKAPASPQL